MTQRHLREAAGAGRLRRAWHRLHEPRIISAVYGTAYAVAAIVGVWTTVSPPQSIEGQTGPVLMGMITVMVTIGGLIGVWTTLLGVYWAERTAAWAIIAGLTAWGGMTAYLQATGTGNRGLTLMACLFAIGLFSLRFYWIGDRPYNPRSHPVPPTSPEP